MKPKIIESVRAELKQQIDEKTKNSTAHFFKEPVLVYGVKTAAVNAIARKYFAEVKPLGKKATFDICEELLKSDYCEEAFIAFEWSERWHQEYVPEDLETFERWLNKYVNNWAKCDTLCNHTIGSFIDMYPQYTGKLKQWAKSDNRWLRRAAAVTLIIPAKQGKFLSDIFEIADMLLTDKDDLVQKGYGWLLKDAVIKHQDEVLAYIMRNKQAMPRTALRYAIERMPNELKKKAMEK